MPLLTIVAANLGKDYNYQRIFSGLDGRFHTSQSFAVIGRNGSGKSTFLRVLSGMDSPTYGKVHWTLEGKTLPVHRQHEFLSFCSPGLAFDSRFTVREIIAQYCRVKPMIDRLSVDDLIEEIGFQNHQYKYIDELSSGMNQRVRLVLTICTDMPVLFLDEPCSNLDHQGMEWYDNLVTRYATKKLVFVASNDPREYTFCKDHLSMADYKR